MKSIIEDIYYGNRGGAEDIDFGKVYFDAQSKACTLYEKMEKGLNEKKKKLLSKIFWADVEQEAEAVKAAYIEGFKIGFNIAVECLTK